MIKQSKNRLTLRFRRWSRKSYAVFQSLGKIVTIGSLRKSAIEMSVAKESNTNSARIGLSSYEHNEKEETDEGSSHDTGILSLIEKTILILQSVSVRYEVSAHACGVSTYNILANQKRTAGISHTGSPFFYYNRL